MVATRRLRRDCGVSAVLGATPRAGQANRCQRT